jgi:hypothetical protein
VRYDITSQTQRVNAKACVCLGLADDVVVCEDMSRKRRQ